MRILLVNAVGAMGGAEWSLLELAEALLSQSRATPPGATSQHNENDNPSVIEAALPAGPLSDRLRAVGIAVHPLPPCRAHRPRAVRAALSDGAALLRGVLALRRVLRAVRPDVIHANGTTALLLAGAAVLGGARPALLWHCRDLMRADPLTGYLGRSASVIVATSTAVEAALRRALPEARQTRIVLVPNGIQLERFNDLPDRSSARAALGLPSQGPIIGMIAHFAPWKRHDRFIEIVAELAVGLPSLSAIIAGGDPFGDHPEALEQIVTQAARVGIADHLRCLPSPQGTLVPLLLRALDVLIHPADGEPFGRVLCEAMAAECPVVAFDEAGPASILAHNITGLLVAPGDTAGMAKAVRHLLNNPSLSQTLTEKAHAAVAEHFDIHRVAAAMLPLYRLAIRKNHSGGGTNANGHSRTRMQ